MSDRDYGFSPLERMRDELEQAERESRAAIQKLLAERDAAREDRERMRRELVALRDDVRDTAGNLQRADAPHVAHDAIADRIDAILRGES